MVTVICAVLGCARSIGDGVTEDIRQGLAGRSESLNGGVTVVDRVGVAAVGSNGDRSIGAGYR